MTIIGIVVGIVLFLLLVSLSLMAFFLYRRYKANAANLAMKGGVEE